jgi:bifunctional non-homologous end joining protein LigD
MSEAVLGGKGPMLAVLGDLPLGDDWSYEIKWDGVRALARIDAGGYTLTARSGTDITARYPELAELAKAVPKRSLPVTLDGEIIAFDDSGRPDFGRLQGRMHLNDARKIDALAESDPVSFAVFDLLEERGASLAEMPWSERRARLEALEVGVDGVSVPAAYDDGEALLELVAARGIEGVVAKRHDSRYLPGKRGSGWVKVKPKPRQEFVVGGWTDGSGHREGTLGALLLGYYEDGELVHAGNVGSGFNDRVLDELSAALAPLAVDDNPFSGPVTGRKVHFAMPQLVAEIEYGELTADGHLRHPVFKGLREDKPADQVVLERKH